MTHDEEMTCLRLAEAQLKLGNKLLKKGNHHISNALDIMQRINDKKKRRKLTVVK